MKTDYTIAVLQLIKEGKDPEAVIAGLTATLTSRGHERLLVPVLRVAREVAKESVSATVTVASESDRARYQAAIEAALATLGAADATTVVDETITGGFIAEHNHTRIDASFKSKLIDLYRSLTK